MLTDALFTLIDLMLDSPAAFISLAAVGVAVILFVGR